MPESITYRLCRSSDVRGFDGQLDAVQHHTIMALIIANIIPYGSYYSFFLYMGLSINGPKTYSD